MVYDYGLNWLNQKELYNVTEHAFKKAIDARFQTPKNPPDPFTLVAQAVIGNESLEKVLEFETTRTINKTLSNNVGLWHQSVLSLAPAWENLGANGGGIDLKMKAGLIDDRFQKPLVAEVKNRFNTIKASDEKALWDKLDLVSKTHGAVAYVFQIVPKTANRYDCPWKVSGRTEKETIRCCDGATAYDMVFKRKGALYDIYKALPEILSDILNHKSNLETDIAKEIFYKSIPF